MALVFWNPFPLTQRDETIGEKSNTINLRDKTVHVIGRSRLTIGLADCLCLPFC